MAFVDDLKATLEKTSMRKDEVEKVVRAIIGMHGGSYPYIRHNIPPNCRKKNR